MEQLTKYTLYIGLNDKDSKVQKVSTEQAQSIVNTICGDNTTQVVRGHYTHDDGTQINETTLKVELLFKKDEQVLNMVSKIKKQLNQESVAVSKTLEMSALL